MFPAQLIAHVPYAVIAALVGIVLVVVYEIDRAENHMIMDMSFVNVSSKTKLNVCRFIGAAKRGHKYFFISLCGILDIVKGFVQRSFNRLNLCNRHISASTPFISSMSSW